MWENLIAFFAVIVVIFVIARICRDHRVFSRLLLGACLAFIVGLSLKHSIASDSFNSVNVTNVDSSSSTSYDLPSAVVWTEGEIEDTMSQNETNRDTTLEHLTINTYNYVQQQRTPPKTRDFR